MIIRKPYAFLIKNFKKIHIVLLILSLFVAYQLINVSSFVSEFMSLGTYDLYADPITNHITFLLMLSIFIIVVFSGALILLLRHKEKPWKAYLIPFIEYFVLFFVLQMIKSFFNNFSDTVESTDLRMSRDLLMIFIVAQVPAIIIFVMRTFGLDNNKFHFNSDAEFLELSEEDREEIEIRLDVDVNSFKRTYRKLFRNIGYLYKEHKMIFNTIFTVIIVIILFNTYKFIFVTNKTYSTGDNYNANGYTFKVNNAYYTDKDYTGNIVESNSDFVILDISITNNDKRRSIKMENFHLKNGKNDYTTTDKVYASDFIDFGTPVDSSLELRRDQTINTIIIYKVAKKKWVNSFVLYYQEVGGDNKLRKIKLNVKDVSKIEDAKQFSLGDTFDIEISGKKDNLSFDLYEISKNTSYYFRTCISTGCEETTNDLAARAGENILKINFASDEFESKNMIDFLVKYGKIVYKDSSGEENEISIENAVDKSYYGKVVYLRVPEEVTNDTNVSIKLIVRNKQYLYELN